MSPDAHIAFVISAIAAVDAASAATRIAEAIQASSDKDHAGAVLSPATADVLERNALHEASHAVVASRLGLRVGCARIRGDGSGSAEYEATTDDDAPHVVAADLAGIFAELIRGVDRSRQEALAHCYDMLKARVALDRIAVAGWPFTVKAVATMSCCAVYGHWAAIRRVAACLRAVSELNAAEISALSGRPS